MRTGRTTNPGASTFSRKRNSRRAQASACGPHGALARIRPGGTGNPFAYAGLSAIVVNAMRIRTQQTLYFFSYPSRRGRARETPLTVSSAVTAAREENTGFWALHPHYECPLRRNVIAHALSRRKLRLWRELRRHEGGRHGMIGHGNGG